MRNYAELVKRLHKRIALTTAGSPLQDDLQDAADAIEELLAKVPKNGKWIAERDGSIVELSKDGFVGDSCHCSVCNEHLDGSEEYAVKGIFCPSCGAIMNR
jgi:hypothetical protein